MLSDCVALICVLQVEASSELEPLSCHSTEDPSVSLPRRCFVCYAFSPQTSPRLLKDPPICFPNTSRSFETAVSLFRTIGGKHQGYVASTRDSTRLRGKFYRSCLWEKKWREMRIFLRGAECSLTARQTATSNQNRRVSDCHPAHSNSQMVRDNHA